eukprot:5340854-Karenia_brevis.AAC.1
MPWHSPGPSKEQAEQRVAHCKVWHKKSPLFWKKDVDLIIDNKRWDVPTTERARKYLQKQRVRLHLRTPQEGSLPHMTKPGRKKNRMNTGASAS